MTKNYHILGLMPELVTNYFAQGLAAKAQANGIVSLAAHQLREYADTNYKSVDDKPYGGGAGMVVRPEIICNAVRTLKDRHAIKKVILTSPRGSLFNAKKARLLSAESDILFVCGRYEGIDQRAIDAVIDEEISLGDYILSGGEAAALVMLDAVIRLVPGVVGNAESIAEDSFEEGLLEYPHYTRPEVFEGTPVPEALLSGNHARIRDWRRKESVRTTWQRRPDLLKKAHLTDEERDFILKLIHK